mgnify:FL=1
MATKQSKQAIYSLARKKTQCGQDDWARIFSLGGKKGQPEVSKKEKGTRQVNMPEALAAQLLQFLFENGYDVKNMEFDSDGIIKKINKK